MSHDVKIPRRLAHQGWKVKIRENERNEPPHVSVLRKTDAWRDGLRERKFLDADPEPRRVDDSLVAFIELNVNDICKAWDAKYPENSVRSKENDDDDPGE